MWRGAEETPTSGVHLDHAAIGLSAPSGQVLAHADYEVAQTQFEVMQAMAQARLELAAAKRAVVHSHVRPWPSDASLSA